MDLSKFKKFDVSGIVGDIKSMINPGGGTPEVDPDDDLGLKIAEITTLLTQMAETQAEHVKHLQKINQLLNIAFQDIKKLRDEVHGVRDKKVADAPAEQVSEKSTQTTAEAEKKSDNK